MSNTKFNSADFERKPRPVEPRLPDSPDGSKRKKQAKAPAAPNIVGDHSAGKSSIRLMDSLSLTYEPEWERVLHNVGVTHN